MELKGIGGFFSKNTGEVKKEAKTEENQSSNIKDYWKSATGEQADNMKDLMKEIGKCHKERPFGPVEVTHYGSRAAEAPKIRKTGHLMAAAFGVGAAVTAGLMMITSPLSMPILAATIAVGALSIDKYAKARSFETEPQKIGGGTVTVEKTENLLTDKQKEQLKEIQELMKKIKNR